MAIKLMVSFSLYLWTYFKTTNSVPNQKPDIWPFNVAYSSLPTGLQSPIDIPTSTIKSLDLPPLMIDFDKMTENVRVKCENNGESFTCSIPGSQKPTVQGGPLQQKFSFDNAHFHFGTDKNNGNEHVVNGMGFAAELHILFYNTKYVNATQAREHQDGLCVLAWIGIHKNEASQNMKNIFESVSKVAPYGQNVDESWPSIFGFLSKLIQPYTPNTGNWMTYPGSLTRPPFSEGVSWIIFENLFAISDKELDQFRRMEKEDGTLIVEHTRDICLRNNRPIYKPKNGEFRIGYQNWRNKLILP